MDGNYSRVYRLTLEFENAKQLKAKLGISYNHLCKVFSDHFVPQLMNETLKELRRAAELDLSVPKNASNTEVLKKIVNKTVKATKVQRGTQEEGHNEVAAEEDLIAQDKQDQSDADSDKGQEDDLMDIDGFQKQKVTSYGNDSD